MAGRGRAPKDPEARRNAVAPQRGDWQATPGVGWQHGAVPPPPDGLLAPSRTAWETWMRAWFAAHWTPDDLPGLRKVVQLYDATERGELHRSAELRMSMDNYGITPKGQQDRRWTRPKPDEALQVAPTPTSGKYARLKAVS